MGVSRVKVCLESCFGTPWCVGTKGQTNKTSEEGELFPLFCLGFSVGFVKTSLDLRMPFWLKPPVCGLVWHRESVLKAFPPNPPSFEFRALSHAELVRCQGVSRANAGPPMAGCTPWGGSAADPPGYQVGRC